MRQDLHIQVRQLIGPVNHYIINHERSFPLGFKDTHINNSLLQHQVTHLEAVCLDLLVISVGSNLWYTTTLN